MKLNKYSLFQIDAHTGKKLTVEKLLYDACNLAEALRSYGCNNRTVLSICSENNLNFFIVVLASFFVGTILVPLNHQYAREEVKHKFDLTRPQIIFCSKKSYPKYIKLKNTLTFIEKVLVIDSDSPMDDVETVEEFNKTNLKGKSKLPTQFVPFDGDSKKQIAVILCSSGTTGLPKGVMLSHYNFATRLMQAR